MPPLAPGNNTGSQCYQTNSVPPGYVCLHAPLPGTQFVNLGAYAKKSKYDKDYYPDLLTDEGLSAG
jgi:hypothetical protein